MDQFEKAFESSGLDRRQFMKLGAVGALAYAIPTQAALPKGKRMGIVVHSYAVRFNGKYASKNFPPFTDALQLLDHCHELGGGGIQTIMNGWQSDFSKKVRDKREKLGLYLEGSVSMPQKPEDVPAFEQTIVGAKEAGASIVRTVTSTGRRYEVYHSTDEVEDFKKKALTSLRLAEPVLSKHKVKLAVENHKDWLAPELVTALKSISSEWIGATLDFGNSISLMEDPTKVIETLAPYVITTHVKDMGVEEYQEGFLLSEVPLGKGFIDLKTMYALCLKYNPNVNFNLEMITRDPLQIPCLTESYWKSFETVPGGELARTLRMVKEKQSSPLPRVSQLVDEEKAAVENKNIVECLQFSKTTLEG